MSDSDGSWRAAILEVSLDAIVGMNQRGNLVEFNPAAEAMFGYRAAEVIGRPLADVIVPSELRDRHRDGLLRYLATDEPRILGRRVELPAMRADGTVFPAEVVVTRIPRPGPAVFVGFVRDLTTQRHAEAARERAESELVEAHRHKDQFIATLGHELRDPLSAIVSSIALLGRRAADDPALLRLHDVVERQAARMRKLVEGVLDVSRIARGKVVLDRRRLDLVALVRASVEDRRGRLEAQGLEVRTALGSEPLTVDGDTIRLAQVFDNLLANAGKFTPSPGRIEVSAAGIGSEAVVRISDTGRGIDPAHAAHLFEPFSQGPGVEASTGGLGLGLSVVRGLVGLHGGQIEVRSDGLGRGAEFTVRLPLAPPAAAAP